MVQLRDIDEQNFPTLARYIHGDFTLVTGVQKVWTALLNCSGMDEPTARDSITGGIRSPILIIAAIQEDGAFRSDWPDNIELALDLAKQFEQDFALKDAQALVTSTLLTQIVAWRRAQEGGSGWQEFSRQFLVQAYGDAVPKRYWGIPTGSGATVPSGSTQDRPAAAFNYFVAQGWTKAQAAGLVANIEAESSFDYKNNTGDGGTAYGLCQWHLDRQKLFKPVFGHPIQESTFEEQLAFVDYELRHSEHTAGADLKLAATPEEAGQVVSREYERPGKTEAAKEAAAKARAASAADWYKRMA